MTESRVPTAPRVAYQGEPGAFGEMAIVHEWRGLAAAVGAPTFADALSLLGSGRADYAVFPVWNSTIGDIHDTRVLLSHHAPRIDAVSELTLPVVHCVLALPGASMTTVRYVGSHPTALAQCRRLFASRRGLQPCIAYDTAGAARELAALGGDGIAPPPRNGAPPWFEPYRSSDPTALAVIAGAAAARLYRLVVLAEGVQDQPTNVTRFTVVKAQEGARW
jgi:prephenate dehydratase